MKKILGWVCVLLVCFSAARVGHAEKMVRIVAIVNGDVITQDELDAFAQMSLLDDEADPEIKDPDVRNKYFLDTYKCISYRDCYEKK